MHLINSTHTTAACINLTHISTQLFTPQNSTTTKSLRVNMHQWLNLCITKPMLL